MSVLEPNSRHLRKVLIFCFHLKKTAAEAHRMLSSTYGEATRIGRIIWSDSTSHFETPQSHGSDSKARKLGSVRVEAERC